MPLFVSNKRLNAITNAAAAQALQAFSMHVPEKVYIERDDEGGYEYSENPPAHIDKFYDLLNGYYSKQNFIELFYCLPEIFAPIHEIASRVADCNWQLIKDWGDYEVDYKNEDFNRLFTQPNPLQTHKELIYQAVCYEILTGGQFFHGNGIFDLVDFGEKASNISSFWNLAAHAVEAELIQNSDPYTMNGLNDLVREWRELKYWGGGGYRPFTPESVIPIIHRSLEKPFDLNCRKPLLLGAEKPIQNLLPVYEARGVIYIRRGAMGFFVSKKTDQTGTQAFTRKEKDIIEDEIDDNYGIVGGSSRGKKKTPIGVTSQPVEFVKTSMNMQELQPFEETQADAIAIYCVLRVPRHLAPTKDKSTFDNANTDMKSFYIDTIIPWANKYAQAFTNFFKFNRRYIKADFSHIQYLQDDKQKTADANNTDGETWEKRFLNSVCSLNEWIAAIDGIKGSGPLFEKKLAEMTPEEIELVKAFLSMKAKPEKENENGIDKKSSKTKTGKTA